MVDKKKYYYVYLKPIMVVAKSRSGAWDECVRMISEGYPCKVDEIAEVILDG